MRKNREKFHAVCGRIRNMKANHAREIDAATKGATSMESRRVPLVAACVVSEGQWLCSMCEKKVLSNKHELSKEDKSKLEKAKAFFDTQVKDYSDEVSQGGFIRYLDAAFIIHMEAVATIVVRLDAEAQARKAKALALENLGVDDDEEEIDAEDAA